MNASLIAALLLPWLAGTLSLAAVRGLQGKPPHPGRLFRLLGYGFFLGYALLYLMITAADSVIGSVSTGMVLAALSGLAAVSGLMTWWTSRRRQLPDRNRLDEAAAGRVRPGRAENILAGVLLALIVLHLLFAAVDILSIPVYPWDAWLLWMYRAKAWFFSQGLAEIASPTAWIAADAVPPYTVSAFRYPEFLSVIGFWTAGARGAWSETWVNLPGLLCAVAIGLALYGHLLRLGLRLSVSLAILYLLYSTPLFGAHVSLGGYADIWMAGFAGLGFVALLSGLPRREPGYIILGLALLGFAVLVKNEGAAWLLLGILLTAVLALPGRWLATVGGLAAVLIILAVSTGSTLVQLPGLGPAGIQDGQLFLPLIGHFPLQVNDVVADYITNLFALGSWNLLWVVLPVAAVANLVRAGNRSQRTSLVFLLLFVTSQALIFGFTNQGQWAHQYTAINRLPLHFLPALLFCVGIAASGLVGISLTAAANGRFWRAAVVSTILVSAGLAAWLYVGSDRSTPRQSPDLDFVMGSGSSGNGQILIEHYQQGFALLSSGPTELEAANFPFLELAIADAQFSDPDLAPAFFWRRADAPGQVSRLTLAGNGLVRLSGNSDWTGPIVEYGLLVPAVPDLSPRLQRLALEPDSLANRWRATRDDWTRFEPWSLRSVNFIWGGGAVQPVRLPPVVIAWSLVMLFLLAMPASRRGFAGRGSVAALVLLSGWLLLDARWTVNGARQMQQSLANGWSATDSERLAALPEGDIWELLQRFEAKTEEDAQARFLVVGSRSDYDYYLQRTKYLLLPHSAYVTNRLLERFERSRLDYVIFIGDFVDNGGWSATWQRLPMSDSWRQRLELVDSSDMAILFRVKR